MFVLLNPSVQRQEILPLPPCTPIAQENCRYIRSIAQGKEGETDTEVLAQRVAKAVLMVQQETSSNKLCQLDEEACRAASLKLSERQIKKGWIVLGYIFFIFIIPAVLAYQASQNNAALCEQIQKLAQLSGVLKRHQPQQQLEQLRLELEKLLDEFEALKAREPSADAEVTTASKLDRINFDTELSKIDRDILRIDAQVETLVKEHQELRQYVPERVLPALPESDLEGLSSEVSSLASRVRAEVISAKAASMPQSYEVAVEARDEGIKTAHQHIQALIAERCDHAAELERALRTVRAPRERHEVLQSYALGGGIVNGGNSCYMASVIQAMRWNPTVRYLVKREMPAYEFSTYFDEATGKPIFKQDTPGHERYRKNVQRALKAIFEALDIGQTLTPAQINHFRDLLAAGDSRQPSAWNQKDANGQYLQQDAQEFQQYIEDLLLKSTIANPMAYDECFISGLQEETRRDLQIVAGDGLLRDGIEGAEAAATVYHVSSKREYPSMHFVNIPYVMQDEGAFADTKAGSPQEFLGLRERHETLESYTLDLDSASEALDELRACAQVKVNPSKDGEKGALVRKEDGLYRVGSAKQVETLVSNPPVLTFTFKRYAFSEWGETLRINGPIAAIPSEFTLPSQGESEISEDEYEIVSCICHMGESPAAGHYISYLKMGDRWYLYNDGSVVEAPSFDPATNPDVYMAQYSKRGLSS
jgi:ubiquitin C-terminal hydrolase